MPVVIALNVTYVPWEIEGRAAADHGEPAMVLRFLQVARELGLKYQFFVSQDVRRAFPKLVDTILNEAHELDVPPANQASFLRPEEGKTLRAWANQVSDDPRTATVIAIEPGFWGQQDANLSVFRGLVQRLLAGGQQFRTLRELAP
ncbi:MAG: hypothetical protein JNJ45_12880 [Chthonomonas sp.]|nr:hypothetical protein [Chthonomonas sp.]